VPLIIISGSPRTGEYSERHGLHHTIGDLSVQRDIFDKAAVKSAILLDPKQAPAQIDETIAACLRSKHPVYIEIPVDMVAAPCPEPGPFSPDLTIPCDPAALEKATSETLALLASAKQPIVLVGVEAYRFGFCGELEEFITHSGLPFAASISGKSVIPEKHPQFLGVYYGILGHESARATIEASDLVLCLGTLETDDVNVGGAVAQRLAPDKTIVAASDQVRVRAEVFGKISLADFVTALRARMPKKEPDLAKIKHPSSSPFDKYSAVPGQKITLARFARRMDGFLTSSNLIVADTGNAILFSADLYLPKDIEYIAQSFYASIGFSVPAALGVKLAAPGRRPVVFVGDGAFQLTGQEVSTLIRQNLNPIIFLLNSDGYSVERAMHDGPFNNIQMWKYSRLPEVFGGGWGMEVRTEDELEQALSRAMAQSDSLAFIEIFLDRRDFAPGLKKLVGK
jgi:indolepyruvate decarboxylase